MVSPTSFLLLPQEVQEVPVIVLATSAGSISGTLSILSNDPDEPTLMVTVLAEALIPPVIVVTPISLDEDLFSADISLQIITVQNTGGSDLTFDIDIRNVEPEVLNAKRSSEFKAASKQIDDSEGSKSRTKLSLNSSRASGIKFSILKKHDRIKNKKNEKAGILYEGSVAEYKRSQRTNLSMARSSLQTMKIVEQESHTSLRTPDREILWQSPVAKNEAKISGDIELYSSVSQSPPPLFEIISDPVGDASFVDVVAVNAGVSEDAVTFQIVVEGELDPFDFGGFLSLDTDQDPATGTEPSFGNPDQDIGVEYEIIWFDPDFVVVVDQFGNVLGSFSRIN